MDKISRERVEKVWPGCDICRSKKEIKSNNFCGSAAIRIVDHFLGISGNEKKIKFFDRIYAPSFSIKFCPMCGKPLTAEAVDLVMERLEVLQDEID